MQESESVESSSTATAGTDYCSLVQHHQPPFSLSLDEGLADGSVTLPSSSFSFASSSCAKEGRGGCGGGGRLTSSSSTGSLIGGCLFSPNTANISATSASSVLFNSSLVTPRRKLSMDLDESTQDASDSGYSRGDSVSVSSMESSSCLNFGTALEGILPKTQDSVVLSSSSSRRTPLDDLTNSSSTASSSSITTTSRGRPRQLQKAKRSISFPYEDKGKRVVFSGQSPTPSGSCMSPLPFSPCSRHDSHRNSLQLINSPLERMSLMSPGVTPPISSTSTTSSKTLFSIGPSQFTFPPAHPPHPLPTRENSVESDGYSEVFEGEDSSSCGDSVSSLPGQLTSLMSAPFTASVPVPKKNAPFSLRKPPVHSTPNGQPPPVTAVPPRVSERLSLVRSDSCSILPRRTSLKRPSPCPEVSDQPRKKKPPLPMMDSKSQDATPHSPSPLKGPQLLRSQSYSLGVSQDHYGMYPLSPGSDNGEMIGDHSKMYALPLCKNSSAPDLKCICPKTLADLLRGGEDSNDTIDEYTILDCRYPYEYEGGHISGARNIWDKDSLQQQYFTSPQYMTESKRRIIIFHCEFSTKRGPAMSRFLREVDRKRNGMDFPKLYYPELYLLEGGYKAFYEQYPDLCEPNCYVRMLDENHKEELRHFKQRSKSWTSGEAGTCKRRSSKLRPRRSTIDSHTRSGSGEVQPCPTPIRS